MTIIKRNRVNTNKDLVAAIEKLCPLLESQKEHDAVKDLRAAAEKLNSAEEGSQQYKSAIESIIDAFEGDHELMAYTHQRNTQEWTEIEELSHMSSRVLSLARRLAY